MSGDYVHHRAYRRHVFPGAGTCGRDLVITELRKSWFSPWQAVEFGRTILATTFDFETLHDLTIFVEMHVTAMRLDHDGCTVTTYGDLGRDIDIAHPSIRHIASTEDLDRFVEDQRRYLAEIGA